MNDIEATQPRNRQQFIDMLGELRAQSGLDAVDEASLIRLYDEMLLELEQEKAKLLPEYERRCDKDGKDAADRWLAESAEALGRRQGETLRQIMDSVPALASGPE